MNLEKDRPIAPKNSLKKRLVAGAGLAGGGLLLNRGIDALSIAGATTGFMKPIIENHPMFVLGGTLIVGTAVGAVGSFQNIRLLRAGNIGVSPDGPATVAFHAMKKKWPSNTGWRDWSVGAGQMIFNRENLLIGPALVNEMALAGLVSVKTLSTILNLLKATGSEVALRTAKRRENPPAVEKEQKSKDLPKSGVVFVPMKI